jgi:hypothetical protein
VSLAEEFREHAEECLGCARTAKSIRERGIFLQIAQTWMMAATCVDGRVVIPESFISRHKRNTLARQKHSDYRRCH